MGLRHAGFWVRFGAYFIDLVLVSIFLWTIENLLMNVLGISIPNYNVISFLVFLIYRLFLPITRLRGTIGKYIMRIEIINRDGTYLSGIQSFSRALAQELSGVILGIGYLMIAFTSDKTGLHDKLANTFVVFK